MLEIFQKKPMKNKWIFNHFAFMDTRERDYTRSFQKPAYSDLANYNYPVYFNYGGQ